MPDQAFIALATLLVGILFALIGIIVNMVRWQAKQDVYSRQHAAGLAKIEKHMAQINSTVQKQVTEIELLKVHHHD